MKNFVAIFILIYSISMVSQIERVEPPNWWIGFEETNLQLLVKGDNISDAIPEIDYNGVSITKVNKGNSPNYLFIDLNINANTKPGKFDIIFKFKKGKKKKHTYELKPRQKPSSEFIGFNSSDVIYLITPDRFANGDPSIDVFKDLNEKLINRQDDYARHGGDIKGIIDHLDYINEMGFTAIWSTPLLTNDMERTSYHGYAITDLYQVDPRFGTLDEYIELSKMASNKGIKIVMDQVANHCGVEHWWMKDLPFKDWVNYQTDFENKVVTKYSNHRRTSNQDMYASQIDNEKMSDGWFASSMPDLNQKNPYMAKYLIQNSIWWIETLDLGGIRQDTYPYPDKDFMSTWAGAIMKEYPNFNIVGEEWSYNPLIVGYWQQGANNKDGYTSNLKTTMDFPMQKAIIESLNEEESWDKGLVKIYEGLANDFYYSDPQSMLIFGDNHDMSRIYTQLNKDLTNTKMALSYILTLPRIPQIYYGTEILLDNSEKPGDHGLIRSDFPGGWPGDSINGFTGEGLTEDQKDMQTFLKKVLNYRKTSKAIHDGKTIHFAPEDGVYAMFRINDDEVVALILNKNEDAITLDLNNYKEISLKGKTVMNILSGEAFVWDAELKLDGKGPILLTTKIDH